METIAVKPFHFRQFSIEQDKCSMKVGTDGVLLGAWADVSNAGRILDIGTGSGVIAVMLAQRSEVIVHAVEIDEDAFSQAKENFRKCPWADRMEVFCDSIQQFAKHEAHQYDLIVSNPPFFSGGTFSSSQDKASVRHTVKLPHGDLLTAARSMLKEGGRFCVILPQMEGLRFMEMAAGYHLYCSKMTEVRPKEGKPVERLLLQFEHSLKPLERNSLTIQKEAPNSWTEEFEALTGAFYVR